MKKVKAFVKGAQAVAVTYLPDGRVRTSVSMKLGGPFADLVLPEAVRPVDLIRKTEATSREGDRGYTGLVVDYRGFELKPAMVPRIIDEDGNEVYGPAYVSRHYAVETGMAGYSRDLSAALTSPRVADRPLTVKGVQTNTGGPSDVMVSRADAAKIRGAASNLCFLQQCRVMFVLD
jgi:hypothetical protein